MQYILSYSNNVIQLLAGEEIIEELHLSQILNDKKDNVFIMMQAICLALKNNILIFSMQGWSNEILNKVDYWFGKSFALKFKYVNKDISFWRKKSNEFLNLYKQGNLIKKTIETGVLYLFAGIRKIITNNPTSLSIKVEHTNITYGYHDNTKELKQQLWEYNLFTDASVKPQSQLVTIASFIMNKSQSMLAAHREKLDYEKYYDNNNAEIYSIVKGLNLVKDMEIKRVKIFTDSLCAIEQLKKYSPYHENQFSISIKRVIELTKTLDSCEIVHINRQYNMIADELTHFC